MANQEHGGVSTTSQAEINRPVTGRSIAELALDYHWLRAMFEPAHTDAAIDALGDQVKTVVRAIATTRANSIHDLRAKLAIFRLEEDGEITDLNALALIEGLTADLHAMSGEPDSLVSHPDSKPDSSSLHQCHYGTYLTAIAALRAGNDDENVPDETRDAQADAITEALDNMMECPAGDLASVLLKIKAAQLQAFNTMEGSCVSPRVYGELLGIIAADLEIVMQAQRNKREG